ncbi:RimJ/RimL family protein N-acetyltransferase [Asanoa ferruginea]|uniref:RimJ/RimL family protein N-acetyltransferase n=1 Tax=Asanoa ferruginea TaxID=53367 RepID=A0A3D9ZX49_9ACTN|nr:GNAT family N-acetyltransferase [Asanoa ferruginea]REG01779.1 RimJ/RimL family protein N-acetyltransferase [Asanoa ferruginea]GIF49188.1 N-acetyltransferase [Asanoa ferruginea]
MTTVLRPITGPDELPLFCQLRYKLDQELARDLAEGRRRPQWLWVALRDDQVVARVGWWTWREGEDPYALDFFDFDDSPGSVDVALKLFEAATAAVFPEGATLPQYIRFTPLDWLDDPAANRVVTERVAALERTGAKLLVERLRLEWLPERGVPEVDNRRLTFRPVADRADLVALMTDVLDGTLDAHSQAELTRMSAAEQANQQYDEELLGYQSPREWWRIGVLDDGTPVGFVIPARNSYNPIIAYIGVVPAHRGNGYIAELLAEGTRLLAAEGVPRIRAATDVGNIPMAKAFARAGYEVFERQVDMTWE